jgi:hypothetical protein
VRTPQFGVAVPNAMTAPVIRVRQVGGGFLSVTEFAVQPAGAPAAGRLVSSGPIGADTWRIWAMDHADGMTEEPCALITVGTRTVGGPVCGLAPGSPNDAVHFLQMGATYRNGDQTLYFGVLEAEVAAVEITNGPTSGTASLVPGWDPVRPAGARFFAAAIPTQPLPVQIDLRDGAGTLLDHNQFPGNGPVGG